MRFGPVVNRPHRQQAGGAPVRWAAQCDIQLLESAVGGATHETTCFDPPAMAERWTSAMASTH